MTTPLKIANQKAHPNLNETIVDFAGSISDSLHPDNFFPWAVANHNGVFIQLMGWGIQLNADGTWRPEDNC
jgi:hypothetical protein